jgi:hypothetical protein
MSTDFEGRLRRAGESLPGPAPDVTERSRELALAAAVPRRRLRRSLALALTTALVALAALVGSLIIPSSGTADEPLGLGFVAAPGWNVIDDAGDGTPVRPAVAIAANVPFSPRDDAQGLPLSTLMSLPPDGIVMIAIFTARDESAHDGFGFFPRRKLPLRAGEAEPFGVWIRPGRPLGQVRLWAGVNRHNVDLTIYYGSERPSAALIAAAQRQLDRLIVRTRLPASPGTPLLDRSQWKER